MDISLEEAYIPDDDEDDGLIDPPDKENQHHVWLGTASNRQLVETVLRKFNYNNFAEALFESDPVKLYSFEGDAWTRKGDGLVRIERILQEGPCRGSTCLVFLPPKTL